MGSLMGSLTGSLVRELGEGARPRTGRRELGLLEVPKDSGRFMPPFVVGSHHAQVRTTPQQVSCASKLSRRRQANH